MKNMFLFDWLVCNAVFNNILLFQGGGNRGVRTTDLWEANWQSESFNIRCAIVLCGIRTSNLSVTGEGYSSSNT